MQNRDSKETKKIAMVALFSSVAVILSAFRIIIPGICKISFDSPFYKFISIVWGPFYGFISAFFIETIGAFINPVGHYTPLFSLTTGLRGFLVGFIWQFLNGLSRLKSKILKLIITISISDIFVCFLNSLIIKFYLCQTEKTFL